MNDQAIIEAMHKVDRLTEIKKNYDKIKIFVDNQFKAGNIFKHQYEFQKRNIQENFERIQEHG